MKSKRIKKLFFGIHILMASCLNAQVNSGCYDLGFESISAGVYTAIPGWQLNEGTMYGSNNLHSGICQPQQATLTTFANIVSTPYIVPMNNGNWVTGTVVPTSPLGGNKAMEFDPFYNGTGIRFIQAERSFSVTPSNRFLQFGYFTMLIRTSHACCDFEYFKVELKDCSNNQIINTTTLTPWLSPSANSNCLADTIIPAGMSTVTINQQLITYTPAWFMHTFNLSQYMGSCVKLTVEVGSCTAGGHAIRLFFDAGCAPAAFTINGNPAGSNYVVCDTSTAILTSLPANSYTWTGPGITSNNQAIITSTPGVNTLSIGNPLGSAPVTQTINLIFSSTPTLTASSNTNPVCIGQSAVLSASGSGITSYSWSNGANTASISVTPTINTIYTVTTNSATCPASYTVALAVNSCVGISEYYLSKNSLSVYPNSNNGSFTIQSTIEDIVLLTDMVGRTIEQVELNDKNNFTSRIEGLKKGIYFVRNKVMSLKVLVNE